MKGAKRDKYSSLFWFGIDRKSLITLAPGVNVVKLFSSSLTLWTNKLELDKLALAGVLGQSQLVQG